MDVLLNRNHLLALLVCRYKHLNSIDPGPATGFSQASRMTIMDKPVRSMTWRELKDTMANVLFEWPTFLDRLKSNIRAKQNLREVMHLVNMCAARFGELAYSAAGEEVLDDPSETQPSTEKEHPPSVMMLTPGAIRRMAGSLLIMYRHLTLLTVCTKVPPQGYDPGISKYHYEASNDAFHLLGMHMVLPVAARLNYRHDFPGMYNHVSQVVYFHNSQYTRATRHPLNDIQNASAVHVLPALQELFPEILLKFEEEKIDPTKPGGGWYWLLLAGRVYLVTPEPRVLFSENITDMLKIYVDTTQKDKE